MSPTPTHLGAYQLTGTLGRGATGHVLLARAPDGAQVAIKTTLPNLPPHTRDRFLREIHALRQLRHPHLIHVLDHGEHQGLLWYAMPHLASPSLQQRLRHGPLDPDDALELARQLTDALHAVHTAGLLHRDLKPDNVLAHHDRYVLADFGLVKDLDADRASLTQSGALQGTPGYWAPEQASGDAKRATAATDVYGLGATLYAALSGHPPFTGDSLTALLVATASTPPAPLHLQHHPGLERLVLACLAKDPRDRPTLAELRQGLERLDRPPKRRAVAGILAASLGVGAGIVPALILFGNQSPPAQPTPNPTALSDPPPANDPPQVDPPQVDPPQVDPVQRDRAAAEAGEADAMRALGLRYAEGRGVPRDATLAADWMLRAAKAGDVDAMHTVATYYADGFGVSASPAHTMLWFFAAAQAGSTDSMVQLALRYARGQGVPQNLARATELYRRAADAGSADGALALGVAYRDGLGVPRDTQEALTWLRRAADAGHPTAMTSIGFMYQAGHGVPADPERAYHWFRVAADAGDPLGIRNLGLCHMQGVGVPPDPAEGARLFLRAAELGNPEAMCDAGYCYQQGLGLPQDPELAAQWFARSAEGGSHRGAKSLADCYARGFGVPRDLTRAMADYRDLTTKADVPLPIRNQAAQALFDLGTR